MGSQCQPGRSNHCGPGTFFFAIFLHLQQVNDGNPTGAPPMKWVWSDKGPRASSQCLRADFRGLSPPLGVLSRQNRAAAVISRSELRNEIHISTGNAPALSVHAGKPAASANSCCLPACLRGRGCSHRRPEVGNYVAQRAGQVTKEASLAC